MHVYYPGIEFVLRGTLFDNTVKIFVGQALKTNNKHCVAFF